MTADPNDQMVVVYDHPDDARPIVYTAVYDGEQAREAERRCAKRHPHQASTIRVRGAREHFDEFPV